MKYLKTYEKYSSSDSESGMDNYPGAVSVKTDKMYSLAEVERIAFKAFMQARKSDTFDFEKVLESKKVKLNENLGNGTMIASILDKYTRLSENDKADVRSEAGCVEDCDITEVVTSLPLEKLTELHNLTKALYYSKNESKKKRK